MLCLIGNLSKIQYTGSICITYTPAHPEKLRSTVSFKRCGVINIIHNAGSNKRHSRNNTCIQYHLLTFPIISSVVSSRRSVIDITIDTESRSSSKFRSHLRYLSGS